MAEDFTVTYAFYKTKYFGTRFRDERDFNKTLKQYALPVLNDYTNHRFNKTNSNFEEYAFCLCELCDMFKHLEEKDMLISNNKVSEKIGTWSVVYSNSSSRTGYTTSAYRIIDKWLGDRPEMCRWV